MPHNPDEHFDHTVLDLIERSPVGAVPMTPTYQDAIKRLYAAHQVYADADHKGGHVTARSLSRLASFYAGNLDSVLAGRSPLEALESNASIFARYLGSLPQERRPAAEARRLEVAGRPIHHRGIHAGGAVHDPVHTLFLVPGAGPHPGLPGNYLYGSAYETGASAGPAWAVSIHDNSDGAAVFGAAGMQEGLSKLRELIDSAPFNMNELEALGFRTL